MKRSKTFANRPTVKKARGGAPKATEQEKALSVFLSRLYGLCQRNEDRFGFFGIDFDEHYLWEIYKKQKGRCIYTNKKFIVQTKHYVKKYKLQYSHDIISIDRIDSSKPYQKGNIQLVTSLFNKMKQDNSNKELFATYQEVYANRYRYFGRLSAILSIK